ncbi:histidinol-phosphate transaminase [Bacillus salipaludis]|uniref:histidinol-phosphate transaminase n=1 Tax=Bacillus salipaludis TaxID=2547811 RepID=UPI003D19892D
MSETLWRSSVKKLDPYIPGKAIEEVKRELGLEEIIRLASNENPFGPSPKAVETMQRVILDGHLYPDASCFELRQKLGTIQGIEPDQYIIGNGADNIISLVIAAYVNSGDEVVYCTPTFSEYRRNTLLMEGVPVEVATTEDHSFDLEAMLEAITDKTKLVIVCNPNNPTGTIVEGEKLRSFLKQLPKHVIAVLDEAYIEFVNQEKYFTGVEYLKEGCSLIAIRTFSKLYGLAGLRVGYAITTKELMIPLQAVREPFACNRVSQAGAIASLEDEAHLNKVLSENRTEMLRLIKEFQALGYEVKESHTNFLFINMLQDTTKLAGDLLCRGLIIRPCAAWGLPTYARISIGTAEQNDRLIGILKEISIHTV